MVYIFSILSEREFHTAHCLVYGVTLHDDLVTCAHCVKSCTRTSRSHAQPWQRGISHLLGVQTTEMDTSTESTTLVSLQFGHSKISYD